MISGLVLSLKMLFGWLPASIQMLVYVGFVLIAAAAVIGLINKFISGFMLK